jgi:hypothetical protein
MGDPIRGARVMKRTRNRRGQTHVPIHLALQHQTTVRNPRTALEVRLDHAPTKTPEINLIRGALWHRRDASEISLGT